MDHAADLRMLRDRLRVRAVVLAQFEAAGDVDHVGLIIVPDSAKKRCDVARVVAIGPGFWTFKGRRWPMPDIKPGDRVILVPELAQWAPFYMYGDEKRLILKADGILSAVDEGVDILSVRKVAP